MFDLSGEVPGVESLKNLPPIKIPFGVPASKHSSGVSHGNTVYEPCKIMMTLTDDYSGGSSGDNAGSDGNNGGGGGDDNDGGDGNGCGGMGSGDNGGGDIAVLMK